MKKILIIGGGASGLMAGLTAAKEGAQVTILERREKPGSKLLGTGNGHCNYTNKYFDLSCYYNEHETFLSKAFAIFDNTDAVNYFHEMGVLTREKNGYCYPYSMRASSVPEAFSFYLLKENAEIYTNVNLLSLSKKDKKWTAKTDRGTYSADSVIIAAGTAASVSKYDATINGMIEGAGHHIKDFRPALTYLKIRQKAFGKAAGVRFPVKIELYMDDQYIAGESGELQITSKGISGICVFQLSRYISKNPGAISYCNIDFMPDHSYDDIKSFLYQRRSIEHDINLEVLMNGILPEKLTAALKSLQYGKKSLESFIGLIKNCRVDITGTGEISESQVLCGGVDTNEIDPATMCSKICDGLYFCGEIIDIDGKCGGYNLQWAWTSGYIAGKSAAQK